MASKKSGSRSKKWLRRLGITAGVGLVAMLALWIAVHRVPWLGPAIADGLRSVLGPAPVAWMEDVAYGVQDRINLWRHSDDEPTTFWGLPEIGAPTATAPPARSDAGVEGAEPGFFPEPFVPPFKRVSTPADGIWVPIPDPLQPDANYTMYKSVVHPDARRPFAALAVVIIEVESFDLHLVAGTREPKSNHVRRDDRPGIIPREHTDSLFAAFNGGFKATHGHYGMAIDGVEYLPPRDYACTFAKYRDGRMRIATFSKMKGETKSMQYYRQTPPCLVEDGELHSQLHYHEHAKGWGATVSGETVIRRSAIGLSQDGKLLFYGLGELMTAQAIARGMQAAGAHGVAELDVNHAYPRFLFFDRPVAAEPPKATSAIIPSLEYYSDQYVTRPSRRDFFYLTRS
jgi:hypothetical protein